MPKKALSKSPARSLLRAPRVKAEDLVTVDDYMVGLVRTISGPAADTVQEAATVFQTKASSCSAENNLMCKCCCPICAVCAHEGCSHNFCTVTLLS